MSADGFLSRWARRKAEVGSGRGVPAEPPPPLPTPLPPPVAAGVPAHPVAVAAAVPGQADPAVPPAPGVLPGVADAPVAPPALTLDDVQALTPDSSFAAYVQPGVDASVRNAAMKKLFTDPHYNVMDGLDTYIEDYGIPDPIPMAMLRQMNQSKFLGLFAKEEAEEAEQARLANEGTASAAASATAPADTSAPAEAAAPASASSAAPGAAQPPLAALATPESSETHPDEDPDLRLQQDHGAGRPGAGPGPGDPAAA